MKSKKNIMLFVGLLAILVLSACGSQTAVITEAPVETEPIVSTPVEVEAFILEKADGNHEIEFILTQEMTAEEWSTTLDKMIGYGAEINAYEKAAIIEWSVNR